MGYESRVIIAERKVLEQFGGYVSIQNIAEFHMCCMPLDFKSVFDKELEMYMYIDNEMTVEDKYGERIKYTNPGAVISYLEGLVKREDYEYYRRINPLIGLLKGFNVNDFSELIVVHYGE